MEQDLEKKISLVEDKLNVRYLLDTQMEMMRKQIIYSKSSSGEKSGLEKLWSYQHKAI